MNRGQVADIIGRSALSPYQKLVLLCYLSHLPSSQAIGAGLAWPGLQTLATWASCSRSTAQTARAQLLEAGILVAVVRSERGMKVRLDVGALQDWKPVQGAATRQGAGSWQGGVPPAGRGGAATRQGGVPGAGTEPSSENPPKQPSIENPQGAGAPVLSQDEGEELWRRLERLRLERLQQLGKPQKKLKAEIWIPKVRAAAKRWGAGTIYDGWVWLLRSSEAAWHRGEDGRGPDRTADYGTLLGHPDYGSKRSWRGLEGPTEDELEEGRLSDGRSEPDWKRRMREAGQEVPRSEAEEDELWNRVGAEDGAEGAPQAREDAWSCPF
jgi:hypothetical protein